MEYQRLTNAEHVAALEAVGLDAGTAAFVAGIDDAIRRGVLGDTDGTLSRLIGRPTTPARRGAAGGSAGAGADRGLRRLTSGRFVRHSSRRRHQADAAATRRPERASRGIRVPA